jgi:hypothetical protein
MPSSRPTGRYAPRRVLEGARGDIQNDGYAVGPDAPQRVGCNDHGRRRFVQAFEQGDRRAQPMIDLYRALYHVERTATERSLDATGQRALRQAESVPLWRELERVITDLTPKVDKKSPLGKGQSEPVMKRTTVQRKSDRELVVTRTFDAPARLVFEA